MPSRADLKASKLKVKYPTLDQSLSTLVQQYRADNPTFGMNSEQLRNYYGATQFESLADAELRFWTNFSTIVSTMIASDSFDGRTVVAGGAALDLAYGGQAATWVGSNTLTITNGTMGRTTAAATGVYCTLPIVTNDVEASVKMSAMPVGGNDAFRLYGRCNSLSAPIDGYFLNVTNLGGLVLNKAVSGVVTALVTLGSGTVAAGDIVALRILGSSIQGKVNGVVKIDTVNTDITTGPAICLRWTGSTGLDCQVDDFKVQTAV